jgi:hypothetical protein
LKVIKGLVTDLLLILTLPGVFWVIISIRLVLLFAATLSKVMELEASPVAAMLNLIVASDPLPLIPPGIYHAQQILPACPGLYSRDALEASEPFSTDTAFITEGS